jgi:rubredoxin
MTLKYDYYNTLECESCDLIFDESEAKVVSDDLGRRAMVCPNCESGDLVAYSDDEEDL